MSLRVIHSSLLVLIVGLLMVARPSRGAIFDLDGNVLYPDLTLIDGADLSGLDLRRADFRRQATNVDFRGSNLAGASLGSIINSDFRGANMEGTRIGNHTDSDFRGANLDFAVANGITLDGSNFLGASMNGIDLNGARVRNAVLVGIDFGDAGRPVTTGVGHTVRTIYYDFLSRVDFTGSDLTGADLSNSGLDDTIFDNAILVGANLSNSIMRSVDMQNADARYANFSNSNWDESTASHNDFRFADFRGFGVGAIIFEYPIIFDGPLSESPGAYNDMRGALFDDLTHIGGSYGDDPTRLGMIYVPSPATHFVLLAAGAVLMRRRSPKNV